MKKKKIKKGMILLSMVMVIISTILPVTSSAAEYTTGEILYEIYNGDNTVGRQAFPYIEENAELMNTNNVKFISMQLEENGEIIYPIRSYQGLNYVVFFETNDSYPYLGIRSAGANIEYENIKDSIKTPYKVTVYEIIEIIPTPIPTPTPTPSPTPSPTPDERIVNLLDETENGVGTILTWVGNLWEGITTGDMSAILPIFAIFLIIPIILLVIKIIRKNTWGN